MPVKLGGLIRGKKGSKVVRTRNWSEEAGVVESILGSRYLLAAQIGDEITVKYVHEEWDGQWQHHYKIVIKHLDTKCATCGFSPAECICDDPVV
ncbi:MAG TPA: hypothetical protein VD736_05210 [Nitrososphaera sp.]|nr:hypothetical protein [Nitrososphaera sp.]